MANIAPFVRSRGHPPFTRYKTGLGSRVYQGYQGYRMYTVALSGQQSGCSQELPLYHSTKKWWTFEYYIFTTLRHCK